MNNFLTDLSDKQTLLELYPKLETLSVNTHVHTPYSFSAFTDISRIFEMALKENISVVGINDFFVTDGYEPFYREALRTGIFPLFNIEFIGLLKTEQQKNIRVNDPNNPGRCYFSGKGLDYPFSVENRLSKKLKKMVAESQNQVRRMIRKTNDWLSTINTDIRLSYDGIRIHYAKELVRERHIAKAIRMAVFDKFSTDHERMALMSDIFDGNKPKSQFTDIPGLENEIRSNLLKAGGKAFVEEDDNAYMKLDEVIEIIVNAGGIPCYPVLLDDKNGNYTEYEKYPESLWHELSGKKIGCVELIPGRNDAGHLDKFVRFFQDKNFVIMFGTEHNSPDMIPLTCNTRGNEPLSNDMKSISYEGACVVAAHQYLRACGQAGFIDNQGNPQNAARESFVSLGNAVIHQYINMSKRDH
jgi:hypothetical protein